MITNHEAKRIYEFSREHGFINTVNAFPEYTRTRIERAISDHVDRIIESHRSRKQELTEAF